MKQKYSDTRTRVWKIKTTKEAKNTDKHGAEHKRLMRLVSKTMQWSKGISISWANRETALLKSYKHTCFSWIKRERKGNSTIKDNWLTLFLSDSNLFKYAVNLFLNLDDSAQLRGALFQNSLTCCVRFLHHLPAGPFQFHISNGNPQLPQIQSYRATVSGRPRAAPVIGSRPQH